MRKRAATSAAAGGKLPLMSVYERVSIALVVAPVLVAALLTSHYVRTLLDEQGGK